MKKFPIKKFNKNLLEWYFHNSRDLEFRKDKDPYKILVSEIMAQQTQISTMLPYYKRFIERFPTVLDLAQASEEEVLSLWEGLGYYSRARNLRKAAIKIKELNFFPETFKELIKLPGIGPYTGGAVASIAFNQKSPAVDGNVLRVLSRIHLIKNDISLNSTKDIITNIAQEHLNQTDNPGDFNQALMELGAIICKKENPKCLLCPVRSFCLAYCSGKVFDIPVRSKKIKKQKEFYDVLIILNNTKPLYEIRDSSGLLAGLNGFPMLNNNQKPGSTITELLNKYDLKEYKYLGVSKHVFTHKIWYSTVFLAESKEIPDGLSPNEVSIPTAFKKMLSLVGHI